MGPRPRPATPPRSAKLSSTETTRPKAGCHRRPRPPPTCSAASTTPTTKPAGSRQTSYDLDGNLLEKTRRVLATSVLLSALPGPAGDWASAAYQADWQPAAGQTLAEHAGPLLDPTGYTISTAYDALARPSRSPPRWTPTATARPCARPTASAGALTALTVDGDSYVQQILYNARGQRSLADPRVRDHDPLRLRPTDVPAGPAAQRAHPTASPAARPRTTATPTTWSGTSSSCTTARPAAA